MPVRISNKNASHYVKNQIEFKGCNLFAEQIEDRYVVYSYSRNWPLFIYTHGQWFENENKRSVTTSRHKTLTHPGCETRLLSLQLMQKLAGYGYAELVKERLL